MPQNITLIKLSKVINEAMGWFSYHLHMFTFGDEHYGEVFDLDDDYLIDQRRKQLHKLLGSSKRFTYIYDFGDHWEHQIVDSTLAALLFPYTVTTHKRLITLQLSLNPTHSKPRLSSKNR